MIYGNIFISEFIDHNRAFRVHFSTDLSPEAKASALSMAEAVASGQIIIK